MDQNSGWLTDWLADGLGGWVGVGEGRETNAADAVRKNGIWRRHGDGQRYLDGACGAIIRPGITLLHPHCTRTTAVQ